MQIDHVKRILTLIGLLAVVLGASAQEFFNLTADDVRIDSLLPTFCYSVDLPQGYQDSVYQVSIEYPEFIDMAPADVLLYDSISGEQLPELPEVQAYVGTSRKEGTLYVSFVPLVERGGRYQKLVSFMLRVEAQPVAASRRKVSSASERYAAHSVLATGQWAKISVPETGIYQITDALVRQAGFSNPAKVKVYGYGGALQPEVLSGDYLIETDDLKEVPTCTVGGRRLFHGVGPVSWSSSTTYARTRNPYSTVGCYFLTESDDEPLRVDSAEFVSSFYPTNNDYHSLYEVDDFAWYHSGRNLYDATWKSDLDNKYELSAHGTTGQLTVVLTTDNPCEVSVVVNDSVIGQLKNTKKAKDESDANVKYDDAIVSTANFKVDGLQAKNTIVLRQTSGTANIHLDYISLTEPTPAPVPKLSSASFSAPRFVYRITNQDHHADEAVDLVIIIPTNQKQLSQAQRLKELHETKDSMTVRIVPADELFNEFSSGTPDATAYRRYMKMMYDRAETADEAPRYLLLFGDGAWDNRMLSTDWRMTSPDDYLLCYESENSVSETRSYVSDDYYCILDDGEGASLQTLDKTDIGVGRLPAVDAAEAKIMVDKIVSYVNNEHVGSWQNVVCFMGDDGNNNVHMSEADAAATVAESEYSGYMVKRIFWDAYTIASTAKGKTYPDVTKQITQLMKNGALIMDYCGHGAAYCLSHEQVVVRKDFEVSSQGRLPLWVTASCDIMPYDAREDNIGETAMLNPTGGSVAFFGTTRTVWTNHNKQVNVGYIRNVLATVNGRRNTLGDAVRLTKNAISETTEPYSYNKLHYTLLGDPAMTLAAPTKTIVVDSISGVSPSQSTVELHAGTEISVKGHVENAADFNGILSLTVRDVKEHIVCKLNQNEDGNDVHYEFDDRPNVIYQGSDSVANGTFNIRFVLPRDISYSQDNGLFTLYAYSNDRQTLAHGENGQFVYGQGVDVANDGIGPSIYCYLNSPSFSNGGKVNSTPYFYAELSDRDGINASGSGVGHDLELVVDGQMLMAYNLNEYFQYSFGDYRSGTVGFSLPELADGEHSLVFRAWDVLNNSSIAELKFQVVRGLNPQCFDVICTRNPATTTTSFIVSHDRTGSEMDVELEIFDMSGRQLWSHKETGQPTDNTYTLDWDLTVDSGSRLGTGVYLYRVLISTEGSKKASQARKLIILNKN